jgi:methionyl-tRNA formyltransferase
VKTVYLGTSGFAATVLRALAESAHSPALVVTPPDRPRGRGRRVTPTPVAIAAKELGLEFVKAESVNKGAAPDHVLALEPDLGLVCAFGQLIAEPLLGALPMLNVHPSALPRWRGAAPIERAIMAGDEQTAVTVMKLTAGLDSGPIALAEPVRIEPDEHFGALEARLAEIGGRLLVEACNRWQAGTLELSEQGEEGVTYAEKIGPEDRHLDPARPAAELERTVRGLTPHIGAFLETETGERLGVERAAAIADGPTPGETVAGDGSLAVGCADGALRLEVVKPAGKRAMPVADYLRGHAPPSRYACSVATDD